MKSKAKGSVRQIETGNATCVTHGATGCPCRNGTKNGTGPRAKTVNEEEHSKRIGTTACADRTNNRSWQNDVCRMKGRFAHEAMARRWFGFTGQKKKKVQQGTTSFRIMNRKKSNGGDQNRRISSKVWLHTTKCVTAKPASHAESGQPPRRSQNRQQPRLRITI